MSVGVRSPVTRLAAQRPFDRKTSQQTEEIAMRNVNQDLNRLRQPNLLPFLASWRCYPGNLGYLYLSEPCRCVGTFFLARGVSPDAR